MPYSLLSAKLYIPALRVGAVTRPRLVDKLLSGSQQPGNIILLSGPAGFGKTTLLSEFATRINRPIAWLSLDERDNDPNRFWTYLITACQSVSGEVGESALALLRTPQPMPEDAVPTVLINELVRLDHSLVVVLDDFHSIHNQSIQASILFFLDHLPKNLTVIVSTRSDPPWPLARYRARNQLVEIRAQELRFSLEEATTFLTHTMRLSLPPESLAALEERIEGWIAGLQLAALSMQGRKDTGQFIASFSGTNRFILDYLLEEVLANQPPAVQHFLLFTSILDHMCAPVCDALLTGVAHSQNSSSVEMLAYLERANLFLVCLDDERTWFRYHHLFGDLLQARLSHTYPGEKMGLHRKASAWFEEQGMSVEAINHALAGGENDRAAQLVEKNTTSLLAKGELKALMGWIGVLPVELRQARPWLCIHQAYALAFAGRLAEVEALVQQAEMAASNQAGGDKDSRWLGAAASTVRAMVAAMSGRDLEAVQLANRARASLSEDFAWDRSAADWALGFAERSQGHMDNAKAAFEEMIRLARGMGNIWTLVSGLMDLANVVRVQGQLGQARALYEEALLEASRQGARSFGYMARMEAGLASVLYEQNQLDPASQLISDAIRHVYQWSNPNHRVYALTIQSRLLLARGDIAGAKQRIMEANQVRKRELLTGITRYMVEIGLVRVWLMEQKSGGRSDPTDDLALVCAELTHAWQERLRTDLAGAQDEAGFESALMLGRVWMIKDQAGPVLDLLGQVRLAAERMGNIPAFIEACTLEALACPPEAQERAMSCLENALSKGQEGGFVRIFLDEDLLREKTPLRSLLTKWLERKNSHPAREYVRHLLHRMEAETQPLKAAQSRPDQAALPEPLTRREIEILGLIAQGLSNDGIAGQLIVSTGTVKAHTAAIFRKLDVKNRTEAVARARQLHILL